MKKLLSIVLMNILCMASEAQVTYFDSNNFFLNYFTDTGYSSYDWRFEPLKTDLQRGGFKGNVVKVVTNMNLTERMNRSLGTTFTDTTYYNAQGNISKIVAPKKDPGGRFDLQPDVWEYEYDANGVMNGYTLWQETTYYVPEERRSSTHMEKHVHIMEKDAYGRIVKEYYPAYVQEMDGSWKQFGFPDEPIWIFVYDDNGELVSGKDWVSDLLLTYENGQLVKMYEENFKPVTYIYDAEGRLILFNFYRVDGWDDEYYYYEYSTELSYNENGDIDVAVSTQWDCDSQWQRRKAIIINEYTFSYTYDTYGNWTDVVVYEKDTYDPLEIAGTITRKITYDGEDKTGINDMRSNEMKSDKWYNLNGQRVDAPRKGVFICNGRKFVVR